MVTGNIDDGDACKRTVSVAANALGGPHAFAATVSPRWNAPSVHATHPFLTALTLFTVPTQFTVPT